MVTTEQFFQIQIIAICQSVYDYIGWSVIVKERVSKLRDYGVKEWIVRITKEVLDYPVTFIVCHIVLDIPIKVLLVFVIFKWCGGCDFFYLCYDIIFKRKQFFDKADWFGWLPYSIYQMLKDKYEYTTPHELIAQVGIAFYLTFIISIII